LGESNTISLLQMVKTIEDKLGIKAEIDYQPMQPGDVTKTYADISHSREVLGYDPKTNFADGIKKFIEWYKEQK